MKGMSFIFSTQRERPFFIMEPGLRVVSYGIEGKKKGKLVKLLCSYLPVVLLLWQFSFNFSPVDVSESAAC